jgi:hypothetical protein
LIAALSLEVSRKEGFNGDDDIDVGDEVNNDAVLDEKLVGRGRAVPRSRLDMRGAATLLSRCSWKSWILAMSSVGGLVRTAEIELPLAWNEDERPVIAACTSRASLYSKMYLLELMSFWSTLATSP